MCGHIAEVNAVKQAQFAAQVHDKIQKHEMLSLLEVVVIHKADIGCDYEQTMPGLKFYPNLKLPWWAFEPKVSHFSHGLNSPATKKSSTSQAVQLAKLLREASSIVQAEQVVRETLVRKIAQLSMTPLENIEPNQPLLSYGLDSLVAVELRNWLVGELGSTVPLLELTNKFVHRDACTDCGFPVVVRRPYFFPQRGERRDLTLSVGSMFVVFLVAS